MSAILALTAILLSFGSAAAIALPENQSNGTTTMQVNITPAQLSVEVPLTMSFDVDKNGAVTAPTALVIENKSYAPVKVISATVTQTTPWAVVAMTTDFTTKKINTKEFAFSLAGQGAVNGSSFNTASFAAMEAADTKTANAQKLSLPLGSVARIAPQRSAATAQEIAQLVFVFDFVD